MGVFLLKQFALINRLELYDEQGCIGVWIHMPSMGWFQVVKRYSVNEESTTFTSLASSPD